MRIPLIAGNWKMHMTVRESVDLAEALAPLVSGVEGVEATVAPPFTALHAVACAVQKTSLKVAGQNMHWETSGAFTGEISAEMLAEAGASMVILGHSERRQYFGEDDQGVSRKARKALDIGLTPIVCVGETLKDRDAGRAREVVEGQVRGALGPLDAQVLARVVVAYEPVWAIGTGRTASAAQAQEIHAHVRSVLEDLGGAMQAQEIRILYGGSVKAGNISELMAQPDIDGALVGGASLEAESFASIVRFRV